jgi:hypothetical protein
VNKQYKTGVKKGGGPPPGYEWTIVLHPNVDKESRQFSDSQRAHLISLMKQLACESTPSHAVRVDVRAIEDFFEVRDCHGPLGTANARICFGIDSQRRFIVVLGMFKKQNNGATPEVDKIRMRMRWRRYRE